MTDSSIEFVGLVALCGLPLSTGLSSCLTVTLASSYVKRSAHTSLGTAALWTFSVPYVVYTGCNCARETGLSPIFTDTEPDYFPLSARFRPIARYTLPTPFFPFFLPSPMRASATKRVTTGDFPPSSRLISFAALGVEHRDVIATRCSAFRYRDAIRSNIERAGK